MGSYVYEGMDNTKKVYDRKRPFQRIDSPCFYEEELGSNYKDLESNKRRPDGDGYGCGCHSWTDYQYTGGFVVPVIGGVPALIAAQLMRTVPSWVLVRTDGAGNPTPAEKEVYGQLIRSFQTWTDVPVWQWHRWYDWNLHIDPAPGYDYLRGKGNTWRAERKRKILGGVQRRLVHGYSMECEWDCGAFGPKPGGMFRPHKNADRDWAWPMTGQFVWVAGRWIYDCGHEHDDMMHTELHPCKAVATARWEAVKLKENGGLYVPGIQFMFFASRKGGFREFDQINDRDYTFIVDLPKMDAATEDVRWSIGHTPEYPFNTGVLREPRLLWEYVEPNPFAAAASPMGDSATVKTHKDAIPIVDPIDHPDGPDKPPQQVKVTIPLTKLGTDADSYGVIISFGWYDPDKTQARKVKHCRVTLDSVFKASRRDFWTLDEWLFKIGVNGRWRQWVFEEVGRNVPLDLGKETFEFYLSEDDEIAISAHGSEINLVGDVMEDPEHERTLYVDGTKIDYDKHVDSGDTVLQSRIADGLLGMLWRTVEDQNEPLGQVDPDKRAEEPHNPLKVKNLQGERPYELRGYVVETEDIDLWEQLGELDYVIRYRVAVTPQKVEAD